MFHCFISTCFRMNSEGKGFVFNIKQNHHKLYRSLREHEDNVGYSNEFTLLSICFHANFNWGYYYICSLLWKL